CYRDARSYSAFDKVMKEKGAHWLYSASGLQNMSMNTLYQLMSERDDIRGRILLFMPDYLTWRLTGIKKAELSIASTSQILDPHTHNWSGELLSLLGKNVPVLPPISLPGTPAGSWNGISVISVCGHDTQSAIAAVPAAEDDFIFLSCGTWSLFGTELEKPLINEKTERMNLTNEIGYDGKVSFMKNLTGLWIVQQLHEEWGLDYSEMDALAEKCGSTGVFIDTDDPLFASPGRMEEKICTYLVQSGQHKPRTKGELVRIVYESLAMKYRTVRDELEECTGKHHSVLYMFGGGVKSSLLAGLTADTLGIPVVCGPEEATVIGNALVQFISRGIISSLREGRNLVRAMDEIKTINPVNHVSDEMYGKYRRIVKK
ncbi:MAG: rhamnulokinase family protein, partial [Bullifex sp.]